MIAEGFKKLFYFFIFWGVIFYFFQNLLTSFLIDLYLKRSDYCCSWGPRSGHFGQGRTDQGMHRAKNVSFIKDATSKGRNIQETHRLRDASSMGSLIPEKSTWMVHAGTYCPSIIYMFQCLLTIYIWYFASRLFLNGYVIQMCR
jgi:hypothetical protein